MHSRISKTFSGKAVCWPTLARSTDNKVGRTTPCQAHPSLRQSPQIFLRGCRRTSERWSGQTAALPDEAPPWTPDQLAGLAFGVFLLLAVYFAKQIDVIIARSQRRELGLCEECGGLFDPGTCPEWRCPKRPSQ